ncbi:MAG: prolyl oligopeptidase family serine peptidase [Gemmatimonadaceae bacterium]
MLRQVRPTLLLATLALTPPVSAQETRSDTLFTVEKYFDYEQVADPQISPDGSRIIYTRRYVDKVNDRWESALWLVNADGTKNRFLLKGSNARWSPDGTRIVYTADGEPTGAQVFVRWMDAEGATSQITRVSDPIGDVKWSPDGKSIGFSMFVPSRNELKIDLPAAPRGAKWTEAPKYVDKLHYRFDRRGFLRPGFLHLFVVPADGGTPRQVTKGDWSIGYTSEGQPAGAGWDWTPDGRTMVFDRRDTSALRRNVGDIYAVDVNTGQLRKVTDQSGTWSGPVVSPDGRRIAFRGHPAMRVSYRAADIYVVNLDGSGLTKISGTLDRDPAGLVWAPDGSGVYFSVGDQGTSNAYFASVGGAVRKLTNGVHMLALGSTARNGAVAAGLRSGPKEPADVVRIDLRSGGYAQLTRVNEDLLARIKLGDVEEIWYTSSGGTRVHGWIVKPPGFNASRKYPLLMEIHGGPHGMYNVAFNPMFQNFAANGYVVIYTNPRGSTGYGSAFGNAIENAYPSVDYDDLMAGVDAVIAKGFVDTTRMYVGGCSGGGVLSSWVIGHTNRFAAAAVRCPVINWMSMAGQTDIPLFTYNFFAKPFWEDPAPWLKHSPLMYVGNVTTPTLIMTGELDLRTPMAQSEEYYAALKMRGVPSALLRFEGEYHGTGSRPSNWMRTQLYMMAWYQKWRRLSPQQAMSVANSAGR